MSFFINIAGIKDISSGKFKLLLECRKKSGKNKRKLKRIKGNRERKKHKIVGNLYSRKKYHKETN